MLLTAGVQFVLRVILDLFLENFPFQNKNRADDQTHSK